MGRRLTTAKRFRCRPNQVDRWMEMREVRNRIAHDYLSDKVQGISGLLIGASRPIVAEAVRVADRSPDASRTR